MKRIIPFIALLLAGYASTAQTTVFWGFKAAVNFSKLTNANHISEDYRQGYELQGLIVDASTSKALAGLDGAFFIKIKFPSRFAIQPEAHYNMSGYKSYLKINNTTASDWKTYESNVEERINYVSVPIMLQYHFSEDFFVEVGPQFDNLISVKRKTTETTDGEEVSTANAPAVAYKDSGFGIDFGAGYQIPGLPVGVFARYCLGLSNALDTKEDGKSKQNRTAQVGVFCKFHKKR